MQVNYKYKYNLQFKNEVEQDFYIKELFHSASQLQIQIQITI